MSSKYVAADRLLTIREAAAFLGVPQNVVRAKVDEGHWPHVVLAGGKAVRRLRLSLLKTVVVEGKNRWDL